MTNRRFAGVSHATTEGDVYEGYFTVFRRVGTQRADLFFLLANQYLSNLLCRAVLLGPAIYPDPDSFKPERFINPDGSVRDGPMLAVAFWMRKADLPW